MRIVLLVDDEPQFIEATSLSLKALGFEVIVANDGNQALALLDERRKRFGSGQIDAIICDLQMPGMDGLKFLDLVRASPDSKTPCILVSGVLTLEELQQGLAHDADAILLKPFTREKLQEQIDTAIYRRTLKETRRTLRDIA
jgi:CheY-like chemotaxis protein